MGFLERGLFSLHLARVRFAVLKANPDVFPVRQGFRSHPAASFYAVFKFLWHINPLHLLDKVVSWWLLAGPLC